MSNKVAREVVEDVNLDHNNNEDLVDTDSAVETRKGLLNSYHCHNCLDICEETEDNFPGICKQCAKLCCAVCRSHAEREPDMGAKCTVTGKECDYMEIYTSFLDFLENFAPSDEMKLLNYGKWSPILCILCRLGRVMDGDFGRCNNCRPVVKLQKTPNMGIVDELTALFSDQSYIEVERKPVHLKSLTCETCRGPINDVYLTRTGGLTCGDCSERREGNLESAAHGNLYFLSVMLDYIPDRDDLKLLTYSKWTPLRCERCSTLFSTHVLQLPRYHLGCERLFCNSCNYKNICHQENSTALQLAWVLDVDKEFRSLFKDGGNESSENGAAIPQDLDRLPPSSGSEKPRSTIPDFPTEIRCQDCTRLDAPNNLRMCVDCKKSSLCFACLTKEHWGHAIEEIASTLQTAFIQKESEKTLKKLAKWNGSLSEKNRQTDAEKMKVIDKYNCLYKKAIRESDLALITAIKERGNLGQLQKSIDEFAGAQVKLRCNFEILAETLDDIVNAAREHDGEDESATEATENFHGERTGEETPIVDIKEE